MLYYFREHGHVTVVIVTILREIMQNTRTLTIDVNYNVRYCYLLWRENVRYLT